MLFPSIKTNTKMCFVRSCLPPTLSLIALFRQDQQHLFECIKVLQMEGTMHEKKLGGLKRNNVKPWKKLKSFSYPNCFTQCLHICQTISEMKHKIIALLNRRPQTVFFLFHCHCNFCPRYKYSRVLNKIIFNCNFTKGLFKWLQFSIQRKPILMIDSALKEKIKIVLFLSQKVQVCSDDCKGLCMIHLNTLRLVFLWRSVCTRCFRKPNWAVVSKKNFTCGVVLAMGRKEIRKQNWRCSATDCSVCSPFLFQTKGKGLVFLLLHPFQMSSCKL
ncbi:hypothetical protein EGR_10664 [Echinococcus granulosus]|uniref:Uncharacterized protein n=1 Tax=Echinococcus granulosus TaxID=6210 RepID=W6U070_ECHGR|nr:hypothetical protein EGR_10664 [Echinococcus granulosus]EUB54480.1 hypothetical protein EGR_10664 [Echinococcus granulosus]